MFFIFKKTKKINSTIAIKLKKLRKQHGFSQEQVADYLHVTQSTYGRIENGETNYWVSYITPICELYKIEPKDLLQPDSINIHTIKNTKGAVFNNGTINFLSEKLVELYEDKIKKNEELILKLQNELKKR